MKKLKETSGEDGQGVKLRLESSDDPWVLYSLVEERDLLEGSSTRKVAAGGGLEPSSERVHVRVRLRVHSAEFDGQADTVRARGRNELESRHVPLGSFHALEAGVEDEVTLVKPHGFGRDDWQLICSATRPERGADTVLVLVQEGLAYILALSPLRTVPKGRIEQRLPRKRGAFSERARSKSLEKFHSRVSECLALAVSAKEGDMRCILLAGPGPAKDSLFEYIQEQSPKRDSLAQLHRCASLLAAVHTPDPYPHAVPDILAQKDVSCRLEGARAAQEARVLEQWHQLLANEPARAPFGSDDVKLAHSMAAIGTLLLSDSLYRSKDPDERAEWRRIAAEVQSFGGQFLVASSAQATGQRIDKLAKVIAILRFPLPDIDL
jgi:protein pelota